MTADSPLMTKARSALSSVFGFSDFRPGQEDVLAATLAGRDVLAVKPTGLRAGGRARRTTRTRICSVRSKKSRLPTRSYSS